MNHLIEEELEDEHSFLSTDEIEDTELYLSKTILERAYHIILPKEVADAQDHMSKDQKKKFEAMLNKHSIVFDGKLGHYPYAKIHIELIDGAQPVHKRAYPVPFQREELFRKELINLINDGVLTYHVDHQTGHFQHS